MEYYILCPQRATEVPGLITHLISRDICERRQVENYHKCPNCIRSRIWRERNGHAALANGAETPTGELCATADRGASKP